ncbi:MAG: tyrosine-type recombinase/integrase [Rhizobacter sp.]|nr:tyrosine-type recombinase/integrase [Chlorobiales bacterium]
MKTQLTLSVAKLNLEVETFISSYLKEKSLETRGTYERALREFQRYFAVAKDWFKFRTEDIDQYKKYLMEERKLSQVSVSTYLTSLRRLIDYFVAQGLLTENTAKKIKGNKRPERHTAGVLTEAEAQKLVVMIPTEKMQDLRDLITVRLMLECAASEHELIKASIEDLKKMSSSRYILFVQAKGKKSKDETLDVPAELVSLIQTYLARRKKALPSSPLLASHSHRISEARLTTRAMRYRVNHWLKEAGVLRDNISPHSLRHTAAKLWLERDKLSLEEVKTKMRHGMMATTKIYTTPPPEASIS